VFALHSQLAAAHADDVRRGAERARFRNRPARTRRCVAAVLEEAVTIRYGSDRDARALARLAGLDSSPVPPEPVLVAEVGGELRAAYSLRDGSAVADPFSPTAHLLALLGTRAAQLLRRDDPFRGRPAPAPLRLALRRGAR
jgi:hypothetical protein